MNEILLYVNSGLTGVLVIAILLKMISVYQLNKKEVIALMVDKHGIPQGHQRLKPTDQYFEIDENKYVVEGFTPQLRYGSKRFLVYAVGDEFPIDILKKYKDSKQLKSQVLNSLLKNQVLLELLKVQGADGLFSNISPKMMALIAGGLLIGFLILFGGGLM